jgi:hypothetical protein
MCIRLYLSLSLQTKVEGSSPAVLMRAPCVKHQLGAEDLIDGRTVNVIFNGYTLR